MKIIFFPTLFDMLAATFFADPHAASWLTANFPAREPLLRFSLHE